VFDSSAEEAAFVLLSRLFPMKDFCDDSHLKRTPERFAKMLSELTTPESFDFTVFESDVDEMVIVRNIPFYTFCAHHILPFHGVAHIAYIPNGKICGISKLARTVEYFSRDLNVQEELTSHIADFLTERLEPLGVGVVMEAEHLCMTMRGVEVPGAKTVTSSMTGVFRDPMKDARSEFLSLIGGK
jgi:GTP cyclohydrolase I